MGLDPFKVLEQPVEEVFNLFVNVVLCDKKEKVNKEVEWVTSQTANWH